MTLLSAILYLIPFLYPHYTYPCLFIWMLPILIDDTHNTYGFKQGFMWGLMFYSGHLYWLCYTLHTKGEHSLRTIAYVLLVLYLSLYSGLWLWGKQLIIHRYVRHIKNQKENYVALCLTWLFSTVSFMLIIQSLSFAIVDCFEGYYLANPLIPLISWPWFMQPIFYFGELFYLVLLVCINLAFARLFTKVDGRTLIFLGAVFWFPFFFQPQQSSIIVSGNEIVYLQPSWNTENLTPAQKFYTISRKLDEVAAHSSAVKYIVMPESSFSHNLLEWEDKLDAWTSLFSTTTTIFIGAHRQKYGDEKMYNSLFAVQDGKIIGWYDKQHLVFFTERQPKLFKNWPILSNLFISNEFSYPEQQNNWCGEFQPAICSEIFCEIRKFKGDSPILFVCNDSWFGLDYARVLAKNAIRLCAMKHGVPIIYVGSFDWEILN